MKKIIVLVVAVFLFSECSTVPITGRKRVNFVSDAQVLPASFAQYQGFLKENKLSTNREMTNQVKEVGKNIAAAVDRFMRANNMQAEADAYKWEFNLIEDKTVNAWCLPGGKVVFYTGIMPICANVNGVAAVMGHEVAHAFAKHGQERMSQGQLQQIGGLAVALGTSGESTKTQQIWNTAFGVTSGLGVLKFSRVHEQEADRLGLVFMLMAGYDGREAAEVWVRMSQTSKGGSQPEILSTHPSNESRIQDLKNYLPTAKKYAATYNAKGNL
ncbi:M48 family metallopeptidase [Polaribacter litorisediminis]|uniref:M48 family metallopeptidase n=1 Tax=Polaribacter litorisediminis TaxID=1908341 RepID=UPI001CBD9913|nr:M48 family metallopeptidase [Polaribacter litorisediminis]UAM99570.1 M48 family metallopeptidase [Polaribacter litorisediminis]